MTTKATKKIKSNEEVAAMVGEEQSVQLVIQVPNKITYNNDKKQFRTRSRAMAHKAFASTTGAISFTLVTAKGESVTATIRRIEGTTLESYDSFGYEIDRDGKIEQMTKTNFYHYAAGEPLVVRVDSPAEAEETTVVVDAE